jgi:hypothetical protein
MPTSTWFIRVLADKFQLVDCVVGIDAATADILRKTLLVECADTPGLRLATVEVFSREDLQRDNPALLKYLTVESQRPVELVNDSPAHDAFLQYWFGIVATSDPELRRKVIKWHLRIRERREAALLEGQPAAVIAATIAPGPSPMTAPRLVCASDIAKKVGLEEKSLDRYRRQWPIADVPARGRNAAQWKPSRVAPKLKEQFPHVDFTDWT